MDKGHGEKWSRRKEAAVIALLTESTTLKAAKKAGISETTIFKWMQMEDFQKSFREAKRQAFSHAISRLQQASTEAVDCLVDVMKNKRAPMARVNAAKTVLEMAQKGIETEDFAGRLEQLESQTSKDGQKWA